MLELRNTVGPTLCVDLSQYRTEFNESIPSPGQKVTMRTNNDIDVKKSDVIFDYHRASPIRILTSLRC
jgi:hypothetical protein